MPSPIHIQLLIDGSISRREVYSDSPVAFGRDPSNQLVLREPTASRKHGELRIEGNRWVLLNLSPNGTRLNNRDAGSKPRPLASGDVISIGGTPVIRVEFEAAVPSPTEELIEQSEAEVSPTFAKPPVSRRTKIWTGIGVYMLFMLGLFIFFSTLTPGSSEELKPAPELTDQTIAAQVRRPFVGVPIDPRAAIDYLSEANSYFEKMDTDETNLFRAHEAYRKALAASGRTMFENAMDQSRFDDAEARLIGRITNLYRDAYIKLKNRNYKDAESGFRRLNQRVYPDFQSEIYKNVEQQREVAVKSQSRRRRM